jgi:transcriptional regulator with GAF, ATPase, and Fis domain
MISAMPSETQTNQFLEPIEQSRTLLEVSKVISAQHDLHELFRDLAQRLPRVLNVNFVALSLHDPERNSAHHSTVGLPNQWGSFLGEGQSIHIK